MASSAPAVSYQVTGLAPGSTHTYSIIAVDLAGNASPMGPISAPIHTQVAPLGTFVDDFSGGFSNWNIATGFTIDGSIGNPTAPSARVQVTNQAATASKILPTTLSTACTSFHINATSLVSNSILMRLLTANGGSILRVFVDTAGTLRLRSDVSSVQSPATVPLGTGAWHTIEVCGTVGSASSWNLYRDGALILNGWVANTGAAPIGQIELGDFNARTWTANYDTVVVDGSAGEHFPGYHAADDPRPAERHEHVRGPDRPDVGRLDRSVAADHVPGLPRRRCEPDRTDDRDDVQRHGPRRGIDPHVRGGCGRCGGEPEPTERLVAPDHGLQPGARYHAADDPRQAERHEHVRGPDRPHLGRLDDQLAADHLPDLP